MKKIFDYGLKASIVAGAFLGFALTASATGTWTAPSTTPPGGNVDAPINVSTTAQIKEGGLTVGHTTGGFVDLGTAQLAQHTTIGIAPCTTCVSVGGGSTGTTGGSTTGVSSGGPTGWLVPNVAQAPSKSIYAMIHDALAGLFAPKSAYAAGISGYCSSGGSPMAMPSTCSVGSSTYAGSTGYCTYGGAAAGATYSEQSAPGTAYYCNIGTPTGGTTGSSGSTSGVGSFGTASTLTTDPTISFNPTTVSISTGASDGISYSISNASSCTASSSNGTNDWNGTITTSSGAAAGTHSLGTFATPGSYVYNVACTNSSGGSASALATITVGPSYLLDVYGNSYMHGYVTVKSFLNAGTLLQNGIPVCLQSGANCPTASGSVTASGGTANYVPKFTAGTTLGNSSIYDNGNVGIGTTSPTRLLTVRAAGSANPEFLLRNDGQTTDHKSFNVWIGSDTTHFRALNDAGTGGTNWLSANNSTGQVAIPNLAIGSSVGGNGVPIYVATNNCYGFAATNTSTGGGLWGPAGPGSTYVGTGYMIPPYTLVRYPFCLEGSPSAIAAHPGNATYYQPTTLIGYLAAN